MEGSRVKDDAYKCIGRLTLFHAPPATAIGLGNHRARASQGDGKQTWPRDAGIGEVTLQRDLLQGREELVITFRSLLQTPWVLGERHHDSTWWPVFPTGLSL